MGKLFLLAPKGTVILLSIKILSVGIATLHDIVKILGPYGVLAAWLGISCGVSPVYQKLLSLPKKSMAYESNFSDETVTVEDDLSLDSETICLVEDYF